MLFNFTVKNKHFPYTKTSAKAVQKTEKSGTVYKSIEILKDGGVGVYLLSNITFRLKII